MHPALQSETRKVFSVSEVTRDIKNLLEDNFPSLWISGEISNARIYPSGHLYFTLKDEQAQISAVMWKGNAQRLAFKVEDGLEAIVHGRISLYEQRGQHQIVVDHLEPRGVGALQLAYEQLKAGLQAEGLFDEKFKKPIPFLPKKVGIITSSEGAVVHDMVTILTRRFPNIEILIYPVRVQGEGAGIEISEAIVEMNERGDCDVLIVGRGGGSIEDLWAFNEEIVVRTIFKSDIPVISAVGHETDFTLADFVADLRAPTPSAAAELAVPEKKDLVYQLSQHQSGLEYAARQLLKNLNDRVVSLKKRLREPRQILEELAQKIDDYRFRMQSALKHIHLKEALSKLDLLKARLTGLSPLAILKKGYSIVFRKVTTHPITNATEVKKGEQLDVRLHEGTLKVEVV